jgi:adenylate cyclase
MAKEIERKFLIDINKWDWSGTPVEMVQAYLVIQPDKIVRVRIAADKAFLTIKGNQSGITRDEFEYEIPVVDAQELLKMCLYNPVEKTRYVSEIEGKIWEIDIFKGMNNGLFVAEIELDSEEEEVNLPHWITEEVSSNEKYYNFNLSVNPFSTWQ